MAVDAHRRAGIRKHHRTLGLRDRWHDVHRRYKWWQLTMFVIGIIASGSVLGALFLAVGSEPATVYADASVPPVDTPQFVTALSTIVGAPVESGGTIRVLNNGDEF